MGLAACQARYLSVTARKNQVEYEALLINQDRTALAVRSSRIYEAYCSLNQPVEPNSLNYYETDYTYEVTSGEDAGNYKINSYVYNAGTGKYTVNATKTYDTQTAQSAQADNVQKCVDNGDGTYTITFIDGTIKKYQTCTDSDTPADIINQAFGKEEITDDDKPLYTYTDTDEGVSHYLTNTDLQALLNAEKTNYTDYSIYTTTASDEVVIENAELTFDENGRITKITTPSYGNVEVNSTTALNQEAYAQAMADYQAQMASYYSDVSKLQAETADIQQQDKTLELKLNQLDTEQDTLATELDAVTKLLEENIKKIFNTFSSSS